MTDYPDPDLLSNLAENVRLNVDAQIAPLVRVEVGLNAQEECQSADARARVIDGGRPLRH